jgi:hypothetical protein
MVPQAFRRDAHIAARHLHLHIQRLRHIRRINRPDQALPGSFLNGLHGHLPGLPSPNIARQSGWQARVNQDDKGSRGVPIMPVMIVAGKDQASA